MADRLVMELEGLMLERLINRALDEGAELAHIVRLTRRRISVAAAPKSARILRELAEKYHIECRIVRASGLSGIISRMRRRLSLAAAFAVTSAVCFGYLGRIWITDIRLLRGDEIPPGVYEVLEEDGLVNGRAWDGIDMGAAAMKLTALDGCAHASVRRQGVALIVEIACEEPSPALYEMGATRDLIALCDGVIASVNVKSGTAMVAVGDTVKKGQVLISGYERSGKEEFTDLGALGSVTARIWREGESQAGIYAAEKEYTGRESEERRLVCPWFEYTLKPGDEFEEYDTYVYRADICGLFVPLYIEKTFRREYTVVYTKQDTEALKLTLEGEAYADACAKAAKNTPDNAEIVDKWTDFSMIESEEIIHARTVLELEAEIAVTRGYLEGY